MATSRCVGQNHAIIRLENTWNFSIASTAHGQWQIQPWNMNSPCIADGKIVHCQVRSEESYIEIYRDVISLKYSWFRCYTPEHVFSHKTCFCIGAIINSCWIVHQYHWFSILTVKLTFIRIVTNGILLHLAYMNIYILYIYIWINMTMIHP